MTEGAVLDVSFKALLRIAGPMLVSRATQTVVGLLDVLMVAPLGDEAIAATSAGALNTFLLFLLPGGMTAMVGSYAAQLHGSGDTQGPRRYVWYGIWVALASSLVVLLLLPGVLWLIGASSFSSNVRSDLAGYLLLRLTGVLAVLALDALSGFFASTGRPQLPMQVNTLLLICNGFLNWVLIHGNLGAPKLGVSGAAMASALSTWIAFSVAFGAFLRGRSRRELAAEIRSGSKKEALALVRVGLPGGASLFVDALAFVIFANVVVSALGSNLSATVLYLNELIAVAFMPTLAVTSAASVLCGHALGARRIDLLPPVLKRAGLIGMTYQVGVLIFCLVLPRVILKPLSEPLAPEAELLLWAVMSALLADVFGALFSDVLRAAGDTRFPFIARLILSWAVFVPGAILSVRVFDLGVWGAVCALIAYIVLLDAAVVWRYFSGRWKSVDLLKDVERAAATD